MFGFDDDVKPNEEDIAWVTERLREARRSLPRTASPTLAFRLACYIRAAARKDIEASSMPKYEYRLKPYKIEEELAGVDFEEGSWSIETWKFGNPGVSKFGAISLVTETQPDDNYPECKARSDALNKWWRLK